MATTNDDPQPRGTKAADPAEDQPPATVAQEAALLVDLLARRGWGTSGGMPSATSHARAHEAGQHGPAGGGDGSDSAGPSGRGGESRDERNSGSTPGGIPLEEAERTPECTCGGRQPAACRVCPVCQLISFVQQVNPDTIDRVADFVGFAATALRDLATAQRERTGTVDDESGKDSR